MDRNVMDVFRASRIRRTAVRAVPMRSARAEIDRLSSFILCRIEANPFFSRKEAQEDAKKGGPSFKLQMNAQ
jgi:hypothetical protein